MDTTTTGGTATGTAPATTTSTTTSPRPRQVINRKHLQELADSTAVANAAVDPANVPVLAEVEFDTALVKRLTDLVTQTQDCVNKIPGARVGTKDMTHEEQLAHDALIGVIAPIQTAAKRKYFGPQIVLRGEYFVGQDLHNESLYELTAAANSIYSRLAPGKDDAPPVDTLPGVKEAQITALKDALTLYGVKEEGQMKDKFDAFKLLEQIKANVPEMAHLRHQIQLAADQAFPHRNALVRTIRQTFLLPPDRPLGDGHL